MVLHDNHYYSINRFFGILIGTWPEKRGMLTYAKKFFVTTYLFTGIFVQLGVFITHEFNYILYMRIVTCVMPVLVYLLKYAVTIIYTDQLAQLLNWMQDDWNNYNNEGERVIIAKHAKNGRIITILCAILLYQSVIAFGLWAHVPRILDMAISLNKSRSADLPLHLEYFVDTDKYFHLILLHIDIMNFMGASILIASEGTSAMVVEHLCGLFELVSYHVQIAVDDTVLHFKGYISIREKVNTVMQVHCRALGFVKFVNNSYTTHYLLLMMVGVVSLSINFYICSQAVLYAGHWDELLVSTVLIIAHLFYMFFCCYLGQILLNQCDELFIKAYDTQWYSAPLSLQKFLLFLMQRSIKSCALSSYSLVQASFMMFSVIVKTSMSYFMVLWSIS